MHSANASPVLCVGLTPALQRTLRFGELRAGAVNRATSVAVTASGKAVNVARVLRRFDVPVRFVGFLGGDTGTAVCTGLGTLGVDDRSTRTASPTRICQTLINEQTGEVTELVEESALPSAAEWDDFMHRYVQALPDARLVIISGTLMPGASDTCYHELAGLAAQGKVPVLIDSHGPPLMKALPNGPWLIKMNADELSRTVGHDILTTDTLVEAAASLQEKGSGSVLITSGPDAALLLDRENRYWIQPPTVRAINPIGSGDSVAAGMAIAHLKGESLLDAARFGMACGAANALTDLPGDIDPATAAGLTP